MAMSTVGARVANSVVRTPHLLGFFGGSHFVYLWVPKDSRGGEWPPASLGHICTTEDRREESLRLARPR